MNIILYIWQLPQHIFALIGMLFLRDLKLIKQINGVKLYSASNMNGGITLGEYIFLSENLSTKVLTQYHEYGHSRDSKRWGWLYLPVIGLLSLLNAIFGFTPYYYDFWTEKRADKLGGITRDKNNNRILTLK